MERFYVIDSLLLSVDKERKSFSPQTLPMILIFQKTLLADFILP